METHHYYFYTLKLIIILSLILMNIGLIEYKGKYFVIIDTLFKISLAIYIFLFFSNEKLNINYHDRILFKLSSFILISMINYRELIIALKEPSKIFY